MSSICPTVTATNIDEFNNQFKLVSSLSNRIHIDLMDGDFAPTKSPAITDLNIASDSMVDIHVMFKNPNLLANDLIMLKPHLVIVHAESVVDITLFTAKMREAGIKTGLALLPDTTVESVERLLPYVQHVLIFGGHLGYHGGAADLTQLDKATKIRKLANNLELSWDGGANANNVGEIKQAGIDVINVGSAIHKSDNPQAAYNQLVSLVE